MHTHIERVADKTPASRLEARTCVRMPIQGFERIASDRATRALNPALETLGPSSRVQHLAISDFRTQLGPDFDFVAYRCGADWTPRGNACDAHN